ncbi:unnamed protein product [Tilletia controversa]|uniref:Uncharacterized protein n=1 Tax=Tilletia controversa TaxID=13291 RepID=A0A8X7MS93_9BASI|nr:hypothetical protein CF328_g4385 [Tilletia controversa]KAE8246138.1 hypothetical protein A4X06_0g5164 [Tilletia controversa]CAD6975630.1 unnamed protein product [Tilletia controversa]
MGVLAALFPVFRNVDDVAEDEQDPATLVDELSLAVAARAWDEHWGLWRQYVRNVLAKIWEPRRDSELNFNVGKIDVNILRLTEEAASVPQGRADDHSNDGKTLVTFLLTASREEAEAAANQYEAGLKTLRFGAFGPRAALVSESATRLGGDPSGPPSMKRKNREGPSFLQPFRAAPSSGPPRGDGAAVQRTFVSSAPASAAERTQDRFCTACLRPNAGHDITSVQTKRTSFAAVATPRWSA